ncbi:2231_t:CDS:1, partial [Racocetra persica]
RYTNLIPYWDNPADSEESEDEVSLEDPLLEELSKNIEDLNFLNPIRVEKYLNNSDEDIVYEIPDDDQIISDLVETFEERSGEIENNPEEVDDSVEEEIISPNDALKSLENIRTFLFQQESASECINLVSVIEKFINVKKKDSMKQSTISQYFNEVSQSTDQDDWMEIFA